MSDAPTSKFTPAPMDSSKRTWLIASSCAGAAGAAALATPFVASFAPSERAKAAGAAVEVDIAAVKPGEKITVEWRGKPVWIMRRTPEQLETLKQVEGELDVLAGVPRIRFDQDPPPRDTCSNHVVGERLRLAAPCIEGHASRRDDPRRPTLVMQPGRLIGHRHVTSAEGDDRVGTPHPVSRREEVGEDRVGGVRKLTVSPLRQGATP